MLFHIYCVCKQMYKGLYNYDNVYTYNEFLLNEQNKQKNLKKAIAVQPQKVYTYKTAKPQRLSFVMKNRRARIITIVSAAVLVITISLIVILSKLQNMYTQDAYDEAIIESYLGKPINEETEPKRKSMMQLIEEHVKGEDLSESEAALDKEMRTSTMFYYCYSKLDDKEKEIYSKILYALILRKPDVTFEFKNESHDLSNIYQCVLADHPEIFYTKGFEYKEYEYRNGQVEQDFIPIYTMDSEEIVHMQAEIKNYVTLYMDAMPENLSNYEKVVYTYEYIINQTVYDRDAENNQEMCSVMTSGKSVCNGYAKAFQYLLRQHGIDCTIITGFINTEPHTWNAVLLDGDWYYVDVTWGDTAYRKESDTMICYENFLVTTEEIKKNHKISNMVAEPKCTNTKYNYYVKEGMYIEKAEDTDKIVSKLFKKAYAEKKDVVTVKCANSIVYAKVKLNLIDNQDCIKYFNPKPDEVIFSANDSVYLLRFYLKDKY